MQLDRLPLVAQITAALVLALACSEGAAARPGSAAGSPPVPPVAPERPAPAPWVGHDADGVAMLFSDAPGFGFRLGSADPNAASGLTIEEGTRATPGREGPIGFWTLPTYPFEYTEGAVAGKTARLHVSAPGARQEYDWQTQRGFLAGPGDLGDQELTAFVRVRGVFDPERAAFELKVRGGRHTSEAPALASCAMMTFAGPAASGVSRFGKELNHPEYDYVNLPPRFDARLEEGRWYGLKLVSYVHRDRPDRVTYRLYVDDDPFRADGSPSNQFWLLTEYVDRAGVSTGRYDALVDWRGYLTTLRVDGVDALDVAILSARPIAAPDPEGL